MKNFGNRIGVPGGLFLATLAFLSVIATSTGAVAQRGGDRGGRSIELAQDGVRTRIERSEGGNVQVYFNDDANQQFQSNREYRVTGTGDAWKGNRRRSFSYSATVRERDNSVYSVRNDWRSGWVTDNSGGGGRPGGGGGGRPPWDGGGRPGGGGGGRPPWDGGGGGNVDRPNGRVQYSGPITNAETGKVMDVAGWSREDGANVQQWSFAGQRNQRWDVVDVGRGQFAIISQNSGRVLDVSGFSNRNGGNIQQYRWSSADNQRWRLDQAGRGFVRIVSVGSGKCLDVDQKSREDGATIHQWDCNGDRSQQWRLGN
ncbi:MAG: RICIN domain-containing protein [Acidobacteriota bacterium]